jgi:phosphohistidine phosphatase SixA
MARAVAVPGQEGPVALAVTRVLLIRHADAGDKSQWTGDDRDRPLSVAGRAQAEGLVDALETHPLGHLLTSGYARCAQTLAPMATRRGLQLEEVAWLEEGADAAEVLGTLIAAGDVAACTHGDVVSGILFELADRSVTLGPSPRMQKGSTWVLEVEDHQVTFARYLPPPI